MILFLTDSAPDYGADYLYDGFCRLFGAEHVMDWPQKSSLHGEVAGFDCDLNWTRYFKKQTEAEIAEQLAAGAFDMLVVPTLRGNVLTQLEQWAESGLLKKMRDCTVCFDGEDHDRSTQAHFRLALGYHPTEYFKRELPVGATWARPLPFGYPEDRIVSVTERLRVGFVYNAYIWEWARGGLRQQIADALHGLIGSGRGMIGINHVAETAAQRMSVEHAHRRNRHALCAISPAGLGWGTNRHLEIVADGCAPIVQRPTVQWPNAFHEGTEALYFDTVDECIAHVRELLGDPAYAVGIAQAAQRKLRECHTTTVRARTVWEAVHGS